MADKSGEKEILRAIESEMKRAFIDYSMSVIMSRALPDIRDGLKPVHRRILYAMSDLGLTHERPHKKSARVVGECFVKDTLVLTDHGLTPIQDIKRGDKVYTQDSLERVNELYIMPKRELLKITLENGIENIVTKSQKLKVLTKDWRFEWKEAQNLTEKDFVVLKSDYPETKSLVKLKTTEASQPQYLNENIAYLLGLFLSDGWISEDYSKKRLPRICFCGGLNKKVAEKVKSIFKHEFKYDPAIEVKHYQFLSKNDKKTTNKLYYVRINRKNINEFFVSNFSFKGVNAFTKKIPQKIFNSPTNVIFAFISGLIEGDGSIHKNRNTIHYGSISQKMINQLMILLQHHGIYGYKYENTSMKSNFVNGRAVKGRHPFYYFEVNGSNAVELAENLKLVDPRKQNLIQNIVSKKIDKRDPWSQCDIVPYASELIFEELSKHHLGGGWYYDTDGIKFRMDIKYPGGCKIRYSKDLRSKPLSKTQMENWRIHDKLDRMGSKLNRFITHIIHEKINFFRVSSVQKVESDITYDIEVENDHEFIANGMVSHNCLGKYHPHGDQAVYDSMVRMAQDFSLRYPLVDGQGNFGSIDGDAAAAMRYSEVRMSKIAKLMLQDIEKETVEWNDNFDGSLKEPVVLPAVLPNLLINGSSGIAVGMATNMAPHNLSEVVDGIIRVIDNSEISTADLMETIQGPDFPTGGIIYGREGILSAYSTGRGLLRVRARADIEGDEKKKIIVSELPYQVNKSNLLKNIAELVKNKKIEGISDLRDESDREGMRIVIDLKRDAIEDVVLNQLFEHTDMQSTFGVLNLAIVDGEPKVLTLWDIVKHYIGYRVDVITLRTRYDLKKAREKIHILEGLMIALKNIDKVIKIIRQSKQVNEANNNLREQFSLSEKQAKAILDMRLQKLTGMEIQGVEKDFNDTKKLIEQLQELLSSKKNILNEVKKELLDLKDKFGDERRTEIVEGEIGIEIEDLIPVQDVVITITDSGYIKRIPVEVYQTQRRGGKGLIGMETKEEDIVVDSFVTSTHDYIMFFTNHGKTFWLKGYKIPEGGRHAKGKAIINLLPRLEEGECVETAIPVHEFDDEHYLVFSTKNGIIKKTVLSAYSNIRVNGIRAIKLDEKDELISTKLSDGKQIIMMATANGQACRFNEEEVRPMGRVTRGVIGIRLSKGDKVVSMAVVEDEGNLLTVTENGFGKRSPVEEYRKTHRGSKGVRTIITNERNGKVIFVREATDEDEILLTSKEGMMVRIPVKDIRIQGRNTMGVRIMRLNEEDNVVSVAKIIENDRDNNKEMSNSPEVK